MKIGSFFDFTIVIAKNNIKKYRLTMFKYKKKKNITI